MKKVLLVLLLSILFIPRVFASNIYRIDLYENENIDDFDFNSMVMMEIAIELLYSKEVLVVDWSNNIFKNQEGKMLFQLDNNSRKITIGDEVTYEDNLVYVFTDEEKQMFSSISFDLGGYDGIEIALAEKEVTCDSVCIKKISLVEKKGAVIENSKPTFDGLKGNFDVTFHDLNDSIKYKIIIHNPTNEDYEIDDKIETVNYMSYEYSYDGDKIAKKESDTVVYVTIKYNTEVPAESFNENGDFVESGDIIINLGNGVENPKTLDASSWVLIGLGIMLIGSLILYKYTNRKEIIGTLIVLLLLIPVSIFALKKIQININSKVTINNKKYNLTYVYETLIKESEMGNYNIVDYFYGENKPCDENSTYIINNENYKKCGVYGKTVKLPQSAEIILEPIQYYDMPENCTGAGNINQCEGDLTQHYHRDFNVVNFTAVYMSYLCVNKEVCNYAMPDHDVVMRAYTRRSF